MQAVGYIRVSTQGQVEEGVSLDAQRAKIEAWCLANGYELAAVFTDAGMSGANMSKREALRDAIAATGNGMALVAYSMSRLARSTRDMLEIAENLERRGADLVSLTERIDTTSAAGRMVFRMLAVLSEFERDLISERTKAALAHKKSVGEKYAPVPFGFQEVGGQLIALEAEAQIVAEIGSLREGGLSYRAIAQELNARGIGGKQGGKWYASTVRYIAGVGGKYGERMASIGAGK